MSKLVVQVQGREIPIELNRTDTAREIERACPMESTTERWGDEIYFEIPVKVAAGMTTVDVQIGDVAYWPAGHCLCIFFGKTPASKGNEPKPASGVEIVGKTKADVPLLRSIQPGRRLRLILGKNEEAEEQS